MPKLYIFGSGGSEGIPVPFCNCRICKSGEKRDRSEYLLEMDGKSIWIELSPDFRKHILEYGKIPDYFFISHLHYDHFSGIHELRESLIVGGVNIRKKVNLILPSHIHTQLISVKTLANLFRESPYYAYWDLVEKGKINVIILEPYKWVKMGKTKIMVLNNIHGDTISSSLLMVGSKKFLYLADAGFLDERIYEINMEIGTIDLVLAHTPHVYRTSNHMGIEDLINLDAKKIVLSHISHGAGLTGKEIKEILDHLENFEVAYDGMIIEF